jgi:prepilin-type N-terminal cleavage/methylation domain-containing protein
MTTRRTIPTRHAFTLLELLIVVAIIAGLAAITTLVGSAVLDSGKKRATLGVLQSLDQALAAYKDEKNDNPPALVAIPYERMVVAPNGISSGETAYYPAIDGRGRENTSDQLYPVNSVALFIESARSVTQTQDIIGAINPRFVRNYSPDETYFPQLVTVFDAWDNPIRYVHPKFDGIHEREPRSQADAGEPVNIVNPRKPYFVAGALPVDAANVVRMKFVRRNRLVDADFGDDGLSGGGGLDLGGISDFELVPDSDGGITAGNRPYFYSAGPDGNPATLEDNIYIAPVQHADPGVN